MWNGAGTARYGIGLYGWQTSQSSGWTTDENGFFLIERNTVQGTRPSFNISLSDNIEKSAGAVSIHIGRPDMFTPGSRVSNDSLVDALVFGVDGDEIPQDLINVLTPGREWFHKELAKYANVSINR